MTQFDKTNTGTISKNDRKSEDWHPEYRGTLNVEGVEYYCDLKIRDGRNGKFFSVKLKRKGALAAPVMAPIVEPDFDDSVPF
jgi:hypothetical protein